MSGMDSNGHLHGGDGKYAPKHNSAPGTSASLAVDDTFDEAAHDDLHSAAEEFAAQVNAEGRFSQVGFLRRMRVDFDTMKLAVANQEAVDPDDMDSALDDLVYDAASDIASYAYNNAGTAADVTDDLEAKRWMVLGGYQLRTDATSPLQLRDRECMDMTVYTSDGTPIEVRIGYSEEIPNGDNGLPARAYRRGEFFAETAWSADRTPAAVQTSPFRPGKGEGEENMTRGYAWETFEKNLRAELDRSAAMRKTDPMYDFINEAR